MLVRNKVTKNILKHMKRRERGKIKSKGQELTLLVSRIGLALPHYSKFTQSLRTHHTYFAFYIMDYTHILNDNTLISIPCAPF